MSPSSPVHGIRRTFTDRTGAEWSVAESRPRVLRLVSPRERRSEPRSGRRPDATERLGTRSLDVPALEFESLREDRQLTPIPVGWEQMRDDELEDLLGASRPRLEVRDDD
jgi:hypothetical protein